MATEEGSSPALPPYPEMILAAIDALGEEGGSNKTAISKHIETDHQNLPEGHSMLLSHHLNKMKDAGEVIFAKNNYARPDPNSPPRRGRGRPPKPKTPLPSGYVPSPPRPRGRPPKPKDPLSPPSTPKAKPASASGRPRGRPPKKATSSGTAPATATASGVKRGRGRPPKVKVAYAAVEA